jgi:hypothetical protein
MPLLSISLDHDALNTRENKATIDRMVFRKISDKFAEAIVKQYLGVIPQDNPLIIKYRMDVFVASEDEFRKAVHKEAIKLLATGGPYVLHEIQNSMMQERNYSPVKFDGEEI